MTNTTTRLDGGFWGRHFQNVFIPQINTFYEVIIHKTLPAFDNIADEANKVAEIEYERLGSVPCWDGSGDMADAAEQAEEVGITYYQSQISVKLTILNLAAVALYHMFEQQMLSYHRRQVLHPNEEHETKLFSIEKMKVRLLSAGIDLESLNQWSIIDELRLVCNTIKHAEGTSAKELWGRRPDLFTSPLIGDHFTQTFRRENVPSVYSPLTGEDFYVTAADLGRYTTSLALFWQDFAEIIRIKSEQARHKAQ